MKILLANVAMVENNEKSQQFIRKILLPAWKKNFDMFRQPETQIVSRFPKWGISGMCGFFYSYIDTLNSQSVFHAAIQAEKDGFDAIIITCFGDPLLYQIRQAVSIPVVSLGESSLFLASLMGNKFGIVTISSLNIFEQDHLVHKYGLSNRYIGSRPTLESAQEQPAALIDANKAIDGFQKVARELIQDGAEIIIPGCGLLSPALRLAPGAQDRYPNGVTEVDGVPIMDVMAAALKMAETLVSLKSGGSSWISRKGLFAQATEEALDSGKMVLQDDRMTYQDMEVCS
jgi:Asp/Glu/hydantoin racemase